MKINKIVALLLVAATVAFVACKKEDPVEIKQTGGETPVTPKDSDSTIVNPPAPQGDTLTVAQALEICKTLADGVLSDKEYYIKGYVIASDKYEVSAQFKNATFHIADVAGETNLDNAFLVYRAKYLESSDITEDNQVAVGDEVIIYSKLQNFKGNTPETTTGAYIYSHNGNTKAPEVVVEGTEITIAEALEIIDGLEAGKSTSEKYILSGTITRVLSNEANMQQYGNINFYFADENGKEIEGYRINDLDNAKFTVLPTVGTKVKVIGQLMKYQKDANSAVVPEIANGWLLSKEEGTIADGGVKTIAEALEIINALADGASTMEEYTITGEVESVITTPENVTKYGNVDFWMKDADGNKIQAFRTTKANGGKVTEAPTVGSTVTVKGVLTKFMKNGEVIPEINKGYFVE